MKRVLLSQLEPRDRRGSHKPGCSWRDSRMDIDGIYENVIQRNELPLVEKGTFRHSDNLGQTSDVGANRKPRIIHAVLALLVLILVAYLSTVTYLYLRGKTDHMMSALLWKAHLERANASITDLKGQNGISL
ncbi:uncharacterized protein LOC103098331 isoform X2 [Monodelphis domestica]|uniref:uncharacterized protein LOC103098331 isoform X2 n=1 Tax=Monodelphis domestica TaxID=13616 RepID=UPI0024E238CC|nr:uncharacterized protein LOC103098331 isoform X2 [Monodelphis domestica]